MISAYDRYMAYIKAIRKKKISDRYCYGYSWYPHLNQYNKNKIHCSCGMCSRYRKTNNKGNKRKIHGNYAPSHNYKKNEQIRIEDMKNEIAEYWEDQII